MRKILDFIKYNNAMVLILAAIFLFFAGAFAQTEAGQEAIGRKETRIEGVDNTLLMAADLDKMEMDFKIEKVEEDDKMYYATYTFLDLDKINNAWQYQLKEKTRKVSKKLEGDLGEYLLKEFHQQYEARVKDLKEEKVKAEKNGEEKRIEITEYSGLVGKTLDLAARVIPGYEPVKTEVLASPEAVDKTYRINPPTPACAGEQNKTDNLTDVYNNYIEAHAGEISQLNESQPVVNNGGETPLTEIASTTAESLESVANNTATATEQNLTGEQDVKIIELPAE